MVETRSFVQFAEFCIFRKQMEKFFYFIFFLSFFELCPFEQVGMTMYTVEFLRAQVASQL